MDFPLPIRSISSIVDLTMPLFVDTNVVYQIDEAKFTGLNDSAYASERALIVESDLPWKLNSMTADVSEDYTPSAICNPVNQELYNLIDSLDVDDTILFPVELTGNILDLPDIQLELLQEEMSTKNKKSSPLSDLYEEVHNSYSPEDDGCNKNDIIVNLPRFSAGHNLSSCVFTSINEHSKRKRHPSCALQEDISISNEIEQCGYSKRRKLDRHGFCLTSYFIDTCLDNSIDEKSLETSLYPSIEQMSLFQFCDSPFKVNLNRQW